MDESWTIAELTELAAEALGTPRALGADTSAATSGPAGGLDDGSRAGPLRTNGRVRDVPNERLIRWYGTVGLVDPPLSRRGRVARYGRRHLLQLVAVKRRQAEGKSLAEIQVELAGVTDETLAAVARVPALRPAPAQEGGPWPVTGAGALAAGSPAAVTSRFWARQPVAEAPSTGTDEDGTDVPPASLVYGIRLAPGLTLLLDGPDREPGPEDVTRIVNAARPLLEELVSRGLAASASRHATELDNPQDGSGT
ncbi:MAG: MerR family transcriptional regulator [Trebonia sp.]|uniref:MerR family transcriptional regulator n=1 Tax=Trebonia sp. TaxID=2767075 RepID=UPI003BAE7700